MVRGESRTVIATLLAGLSLGAAGLVIPGVARAGVVEGSGSDIFGDAPAPGQDLVAATARHDTGGGTIVSVTLQEAPTAATNAFAGVFVGTTDGDGLCNPPGIVLGAETAGPQALAQATGGAQVPATRTLEGAKLTISTSAVLPGGADATCARAQVTTTGQETLDALTRFPLSPPDAPPPPPTTTTAPTTPTTPTPPTGPTGPDTSANGAAAGRFGGAFRVRSAVPALSRPGRSYLYGLCRSFSICRVDPVTRRAKVVLAGVKTRPYEQVSVSQTGATTSFLYKDDIYRAGRDGRQRTLWSGQGRTPQVRADGRSVIWNQNVVVPSCFPGIDFILQCTYPLLPSLELRSLGDAKSTTVETRVISMAWFRDQLLKDQEPEDGSDLGNPYICLVDAKGACARAVAKDATRALSGPATSPDGRTLAVVSEPATGKDGDQRFRGRIELWNPATGRRLRTLTTGDRDANPVFSPDGLQVAFNRGTDLLVAPTRGGKPRLVARGITLTGPAWGLAR